MQYLLVNGPTRDPFTLNVLHQAVIEGDIVTCRILLESYNFDVNYGQNEDTVDTDGHNDEYRFAHGDWPLIAYAVRAGHVDIVRLLIEKGASMGLVDGYDSTVLEALFEGLMTDAERCVAYITLHIYILC